MRLDEIVATFEQSNLKFESAPSIRNLSTGDIEKIEAWMESDDVKQLFREARAQKKLFDLASLSEFTSGEPIKFEIPALSSSVALEVGLKLV